MPSRRLKLVPAALLCALTALTAAPSWAQGIIQALGADRRVDYAALAEIGPWDDRNYVLTLEDLLLLSPNEAELRDPIPAFFRVLLRQRPELWASGTDRYPRSAWNVFEMTYGGYLVGGKLYKGVTVENGRFRVILDEGEDYKRFVDPDLHLRDVIAGEIRITNPTGAAESSIAINPLDTDIVVAGTNGPSGGQRMHWSADGGATWTQVSLPLGQTCCDPAVDWSSDGSKAYAVTLGGSPCCNVWFYRSGDNGQTWTDLETLTPGDPRRELTTGGPSDKEFVHVDRSPTSPFQDNIYVTWHDGNTMKFSRSTDDGNTFAANLTLSSGIAERGIGSDIATDKSGNVYYFWPAFNSETILVRKSIDGGATFEPTVLVAATNDSFDFAIPVMETRLAFIYVGADADLTSGPFADRVYATWTDTLGPESGVPANNHARIQVAFSDDAGATWEVRTPHETADQTTVDRFHPWIAVADDGSVHVIYYDTRLDVARNMVDIFHSFSQDGGDTWSTPERLTTASSPNITTGFEWGDYNGLSAVMSDLMAIYTDNRNELGGGGNSVDVYGIGFQALESVFADGFETGDVTAWTVCVGTCPP